MRLLLIYPEIPETFWSFKYALKFIRKKASSPPLGLLTVAAMLPENWELRLSDLNIAQLAEADLEWADYAFVSGMVIQRDSAREVISRCKAKGITVVAGGPLFTCEHEEFDEVDHFVLNEAEETLPPFLKDLQNGQAGRIYATSAFADIHTTPVPLWRLADMKRYFSMSIQFSRGCPFNCEFCSVTALFGHRPRIKSSAQIIAELDSLYAHGWRATIFFVDDNFIGNKRYLKTDLLPALIAWHKNKHGITFYTEASINLADDQELMQMMSAAGFDMVFIGIETPDESSLSECNKMHNKNRNLVEDIRRIQQNGLQVQGGFIVGFDNDTASIFQQQIDFIQKSGIVTAMVGMLQAPAGTKLYDRLKKAGRLLSQMSGDNVNAATNIIPQMSIETLQEGYRRILLNIYSPEHYYKRVKNFLTDYKPPKIRGSLGFQDVMAFFRSIFHLGIMGRERMQYWRLLIWTQFHRPRLFPMAIKFAIYGYHFRKICEIHIRS
ncbi:MAG: B12-binding domain-containing radical SAM protein [Proteobacteria bacterium]|nr:B12-binding domain-containing radical SAM protein [Pseudomonadota bacterium]MBU1708854.1 B12-binding domain-containing radical SAM protein [Pseudomonadota bacterium]